MKTLKEVKVKTSLKNYYRDVIAPELKKLQVMQRTHRLPIESKILNKFWK